MADKNNVPSKEGRDTDGKAMPLGKKNYILMLVGIGLIVIGFILMAGGRGSDPTMVFDYSKFNSQRITLAPILVLAGFVLEIFAIMKRFKK